jgi:uncharacterized membrane protein
MQNHEETHKKALKIFSATVAQILGEDDSVSQEVRRAADSSSYEDQLAAEAAFDALPPEKRAEISGYAVELALVERKRNSSAVSNGSDDAAPEAAPEAASEGTPEAAIEDDEEAEPPFLKSAESELGAR